MKKLVALSGVAGLVLLASCESDVTRPGTDPVSPSTDPVQAFQAGQVVQGEYIVLFDRSLPDPAAAARGLARAHGLGLGHVYGTAVKGFSAEIPQQAVAAIRRDPRVVRVEPVRAYTFAVQDLPTGVDRIETDRNPNAGIGGDPGPDIPLDIAIIDSGIDDDHPDLNVAGGVNFANGPSSKWTDGNGHGTHVAGTAAAKDNGDAVVGVAPGARVWAVRVCGNSGFCFTSDMVAGIDWVADRKSSGTTDFAVANMSISTADDASACTGSSGAVHEAICGLVNEGVVFSLAAGNDGREKDAFPEVLAVSAMADFDGLRGGLASPTCRSDEDESLANFSNFGSTVDIAAPGVCILSTWNDGGTNVISGTSMAAPHVAGAVALYLHAKGMLPATDAAGVDAIESAILGAALPEGTSNHECSYDNERPSSEPMLFVNGTAFGGDGSCDAASTDPVTDIAVTSVSAPSSVTQGDMVDVDVTVENVGTEDVASDIDVTLNDDTDAVTIGTETISGGLAAGESTTLTYSWDTSVSSLGDHTLTASHDFTDDDGSNNDASTTVNVTEESAGDNAPAIDAFTVSTRTTGPWQRADVQWEVSDVDGDLASVESELLDGSGNVLDSAQSSVSGSTASGEHNLRTRSGNAASVRLTVTDQAGNQASDTKTIAF